MSLVQSAYVYVISAQFRVICHFIIKSKSALCFVGHEARLKGKRVCQYRLWLKWLNYILWKKLNTGNSSSDTNFLLTFSNENSETCHHHPLTVHCRARDSASVLHLCLVSVYSTLFLQYY